MLVATRKKSDTADETERAPASPPRLYTPAAWLESFEQLIADPQGLHAFTVSTYIYLIFSNIRSLVGCFCLEACHLETETLVYASKLTPQ